ncbi:hypothetical protein AMAG_11220 [Allomyces macrogynus ATCC 38327]|uniref:SET domain-containing protein n=1 Tax=Allomyces macrogynus (strain ATCC 38327) TaxID=578462 RepID=A0A0L0SW30_ALLM3|nr:hypothetical protein AMAG_11220 [Allomyces macrogynus ATCC 38327]|eukprot:KNE66722.1 hypothetical protein AMAG_11220 [Allomyces macrogynus ATCC 38327]
MPLTTDARLPPPRTDAERAALATFELLTESVITRPALGRAEGAGDYPCMCRYNPDADPLATACGPHAQCINRQLFVECVPGVCPVGKKCQNRRILTRQSAAVEVVQTAQKGFGLRALEALPAGAFVLEYTGEVISRSMFLRRAKAYSALGHRHFYFMSLQKDEIIDAQRKGGLARFINHSCNPNCETQK